jgi:hypothetical protein
MKRYYSHRSSVVIFPSEMLSDIVDKLKNEVSFYNSFYYQMVKDKSYEGFKAALLNLWRAHCAKDFFDTNYNVKDVLTKFEEDGYHTCVASYEDVAAEKEEAEAWANSVGEPIRNA